MTFHKYPKIKIIGHEDNKDIFKDPEDDIVIEEKIDGGNFRFMITKDQQVIIGSRTQQLTSDEGEDTNMNNMFLRCSKYVREKLEEKKDLDLFKGLIFYGENCVKHTMSYDWEKIPPFLGFDIYNLVSGDFMDFYAKTEFFNALGLPLVPMIKLVKAGEVKAITDDDVPVAKYLCPHTKDPKAEGIVFKNYSKGIMAKYVRDKFKEANAFTFGGNPKMNRVDNTSNADVVYKYCTNTRIDKMIFKLMEEGEKLDMPMMKFLPKRILNDIFEEHWQEIYKSNWTIDFKKLRSLIPKRCRAVLQQMIVNNSLNKGGTK